MRKKWLLVFIAMVVLSVILGAAACTASGAREGKTQVIDIFMWEKKATGEDALLDIHPEIDDALVTEFHDWEPNIIVVNKGDSVILNISNPRSKAHGFAIPEFGLDTGLLEAREGKATLEFVADKAGTFAFECSIPYDNTIDPISCNPDHEFMTGTIIVLDV